EDGIRDFHVTGVQTCALPISDVIHPEQGQVELYLDYQPDNPEGNVMELEVHAPYKTLQPGEVMHAHKVWTVLPYEGDFTNEAHKIGRASCRERRYNKEDARPR